MTVRVHLQSETGSWSRKSERLRAKSITRSAYQLLKHGPRKKGCIITESVEEDDE